MQIKKILTVSLAGLMLASIGAGISNVNVNARHHIRTHRAYRHHRRSGWHYLTRHGKYRAKYGNYKLWSHPHYVRIKHAITMSRMSGGKYTSDADLRPTLHKRLRAGTVIKGYAPTAGLTGYVVLRAPVKMPKKHQDYWTILPIKNKRYANNGYYWVKAIK